MRVDPAVCEGPERMRRPPEYARVPQADLKRR